MAELKNSVNKSNESAAGPDGVHYQFLRHFPESCQHTLLKLFNNIWTTGDIPPSWREASVVPIPKPGKYPSDPSNYRPIALTSCLCKTLERMVNDRLVHVLESRNLLSKVQCGFRKDHSTMDHLVRLETFIKKAFARKKQILGFFFDLEKAYDTSWRYGVLKDLFDLDFRGRLPILISNFLKDRHFKVKTENTFSSPYHQENGVPEGSILSPMLLNLKINNIINSDSKHVNASLFVDDFAIYAEGKHLQHLERTIQLCINNVQKWVSDNGFRFSVSKTTCVHFHRQRIYTEPALHLDGQPIPVKGIQGNENVDKLAKAAINRASCSGKLICWSDLKPKINAYIHSVWQKNWDAEEANKLHEVFPNLAMTSTGEAKEPIENGRR
ncbi:cell division cycle-associated 7-like protein isoform x1 [Plakobranchus ocellatus]|uniref:Cell division cycle-associated 7-like protein isoform x1 n=1 Tax=Plakobranchus ocellatus TaxID=259542 RepID=A0AAV4DJR6_9GAST|nr:cell division cycle-associated 7-like protein isoform x1 [Plakobranchus ocellatus]